jgi:PKD repeat protein
MKRSLSLITIFLFFTLLSSNAQTVYQWYQDGKVVFQTKTDRNINFPPADKHNFNAVDFSKIEFIQNLVLKYSITKFVQLHPELTNDPKLIRTYQLEFSNINLVDELIADLQKHTFIEYAEKKELHVNFLTPNDLGPQTGTNNQWGLWKINAQLAWDISTGNSNVVVAVTDNAINNHPDLVNKFVSPRDVVDNDNDPSACGTNDGLHGTHVSGIVGAQTNNSLGVASIGFNVSIMPIKIGDCNDQLVGGYNGIIWAANNGADIINMSWGGAGVSTYGQNVCNNAWNQGAILVAAAGNSGNDGNPIFYPAAYNNVISVANTQSNDTKASSSEYGTWVDVSAPGTSIRSCNATTGYTSLSGTSMASPMVAGLLGLMKSHTPTLPRTQLINCLLSSADNIDAQNPNFIGQIGSGRINAHEAMLCITSAALDRDIAVSQIISPFGTTCSPTITPEIVISNYGGNTISSMEINYQVDNGTILTQNWTGSLASGQSVNVSLPTLFVSNGIHTFKAFTTSPNNSTDQNMSNDQSTISFGSFFSGLVLPFSETFEPNSSTVGLWSVDNPDENITWQITNTVGTSPGTTSVGLNFFSYSTIGQRDGFMSPPIDLSTVSTAQLTFEHAYRRYNQSSSDSIIIYISTDCGQTFTRIFQRGENGTGTFATVSTSTTNFVPTQASDWCIAGTVGSACYTIDLNNFVGSTTAIIKFEGYNNYGNNLYIDNVNITGTPNTNPPIANFTSNLSTVCVGEEVLFIDQSTTNVNAWNWTFQNGNPANSSQQNPVVVFNNPGTYSVTLQVTSPNGTATANSNITVVSAPVTPAIVQNGNVLSINLPPNHTVQWYLNGAEIIGASSPNLTINTNGDYTATVLNAGACSSSATGSFAAITSVDEMELGNNGVVLFPNPSNGLINVNFKQGEQLSIKVYNSLGSLIYADVYRNIDSKNPILVDLRNEPAGVYFVNLIDNSTLTTKKLIIDK